MTTGTNEDKQGLNGSQVSTDTEFNAIAKAVNDGNMAELDRLLAVEEGKQETPKEEEEDEAPAEKPETEEPVEEDDTSGGNTEEEEKVETPEAAKSAASTAPTEEQKAAERDAELHRLRSEAGRVPSIQRRMAELERELRAYKARSSTTETPGDKKPATPTNLKDVELDPDTQKELDELREIDPVMAKTLERIARTAIATANQRAEHVIETFTAHDQEIEDQRFYLEQKAELARIVPQHEQIFATPEWRQWKETLTPGRRALAESGYAEEVATAIYAFAADMKTRQPGFFGEAQAPAQTAATSTETPESREAVEARNRKANSAAEVKNPAARRTAELDTDAYFKEMYDKIGKDNHIL